MPTIKIDVNHKLARCADKRAFAVCGNNDYVISFNFDSEWDDYPAKTARFAYNGKYQDVAFVGTECAMPALYGVNSVFIGVYAGDIRTTAPAQLLMVRSIMDGKPKHDEPTADVYNQILALMEAGKIKGDPGTDGFSPTVSVAETDEGTTVTFTDKDGEKVANIKNGKQGDKGDTGATGPEVLVGVYGDRSTPSDYYVSGFDIGVENLSRMPEVGEPAVILWEYSSKARQTFIVCAYVKSVATDGDWAYAHMQIGYSYETTGQNGADGVTPLQCTKVVTGSAMPEVGSNLYMGGDTSIFTRAPVIGDVVSVIAQPYGQTRIYIETVKLVVVSGSIIGTVLSFADITGKDGADGFSPTATVTQTSTGADVSITDKNGTTNAHIENGSDANVTKENVVNALGYTPLESAPVTSVNGKTGAVELAASDVGAISDTDGSVQNAHLADSSVTTDKLAEAERMTGANVINAIGGYELIDTITAEGGESQITVTSVNGLTDVLLTIVSPSAVTASTVQAYAYFDGDSDQWAYVWLNDAIKADGTSTLSVSILNGYVDILAIPSMVRNQSGGSLRGQRRVRDVKTISSISYVMPSSSTFDAGTIIQVYGRR